MRTAADGQEALAAASQNPVPDIVLLDLMLPDLPGTEICRRIKADPRTADVPIVMLTARGEEIDRVVGFEVGADDYVVKPFSTRELVLRVRAVLRRSRPAPAMGEIQTFGELRIDLAGHRVWVAGEEISLTALEFRLLTTFMSRKGRVQSREALLDDVWGVHNSVTTRTVDTHVKRLRQKLGVVGASRPSAASATGSATAPKRADGESGEPADRAAVALPGAAAGRGHRARGGLRRRERVVVLLGPHARDAGRPRPRRRGGHPALHRLAARDPGRRRLGGGSIAVLAARWMARDLKRLLDQTAAIARGEPVAEEEPPRAWFRRPPIRGRSRPSPGPSTAWSGASTSSAGASRRCSPACGRR